MLEPSYIHLLLRSVFFWDVTQRRLAVTDVSAQPISPILKGQGSSFTLEDEIDRLYRNVCN
jgi:hypothetical protein